MSVLQTGIWFAGRNTIPSYREFTAASSVGRAPLSVGETVLVIFRFVTHLPRSADVAVRAALPSVLAIPRSTARVIAYCPS